MQISVALICARLRVIAQVPAARHPSYVSQTARWALEALRDREDTLEVLTDVPVPHAEIEELRIRCRRRLAAFAGSPLDTLLQELGSGALLLKRKIPKETTHD